MADEILQEVWKHRDAFAKRHGYNLDTMVTVLRELERRHPDVVVDRRKKGSKKLPVKARAARKQRVPG